MPGSTYDGLARKGQQQQRNLRVHVGRVCERRGSGLDH